MRPRGPTGPMLETRAILRRELLSSPLPNGRDYDDVERESESQYDARREHAES